MSSAPQTPNQPSETLFSSRPPERAPFNIVPWAIAGLVVLIVVVVLAVVSHKKTGPANAILPLDPYASSLVFVGAPVMSESTSISGGKSTYIDGHVKNAGAKTVTAATVQVLFPNSEQMPPQVETLPLALIRTHEPYVDTMSIADAPIAPGETREFRLIFEDINSNWNQQLPEIHVVRIGTR